MKKINLAVFFGAFGLLAFYLLSMSFERTDVLSAYKLKEKPPLPSIVGERNKIRELQLRNSETGQVEEIDYYSAQQQIIALSRQNKSKANDLNWEQQGPDNVGGRTRGFVFDNTKEGRCYTAGVAGGIFVSQNLGNTWKPVTMDADSMQIMPIGCMEQSKNGDIYAGTGEFWGNEPSGRMSSQSYGNGIYKKEANSENWVLLPSTITGILTNATRTGNFNQVITIACDPTDNNIVYAGTRNGLFKSTDAGSSWTKLNTPSNPQIQAELRSLISQIKIAINGDLYAGIANHIFKSTNQGNTWTQLTPATYAAENNFHIRIALSRQNKDVVYAAGIDAGSDLKFAILSKDGGTTWTKLGEGDAFLNPLCAQIGSRRQCQGWYDLCLAVNPLDDKTIYLGGMQSMYTWSEKYGWLLSSYWNNPARLGTNQVHSDMHEFAFHPTRPDTMVCVTDGGIYMTFNGISGLPKSVNWTPKNTKYNTCQFYDMAVSKYGEMLGGAQDNGTQYVNLKGSTTNMAAALGGGDGFYSAISAMNDYKVTIGSVYEGAVYRASDFTSNSKEIAAGTCADVLPANTPDGNFDNVGFYTRLHLAERVVVSDTNPAIDNVLQSILMVFTSGGGIYFSSNATNTKIEPIVTQVVQSGIGEIYNAHQTKNLGYIYFAGNGGIRRLNNLSTNFIDSFQVGSRPCGRLRSAPSWTSCTGVSGFMSDVYVDQTDSNWVVATQMGFGATPKVFLSKNGVDFTAKQGNLPSMPVYSCVTNPEDKKNVIIATEFGLWETKNIDVPSPVWEEQNKNIGRVPVFDLEIKKLRVEECPVLYAASHGRGFWRLPWPFKNDCNYTLKPRNPASIQLPANQVGFSFDIFPNPTTDFVNINFQCKKVKTYYIGIYDMGGRMVRRTSYRALTGDNIIKTDVSALQNGNYIVRLEDETTVIGGRILTKE